MTSLAQQLERLKAPQTDILVDHKKRPSLLFDAKQAANNDRETIYDIGSSGLEELIEINSIFSKYKTSLFDQNARDLQRAVETSEINMKLNKKIKSFLLQLSPYFLLQSTHKCLEWMIRRYEIHAYNQDEFMMLILPYHETKIFARCVQLMDLKSSKNKWHWLKGLQKPGVPLTKQMIYSHIESNPQFIVFIGNMVKEAIKVHDIKAHSLQSLYGFYCITLIGAIHTLPKVTENFISCLLPSLLKGFSSPVVDYLAASYMIFGQLATKVAFNEELLNRIIEKIGACPHTGMIKESIMLLNLIINHQKSYVIALPELAISSILNNQRFSSILNEIALDNINTIPLYVKIMTVCLRKVQLQEENWIQCKNLLESLLNTIYLSENDAKIVIQCALSSYAFRPKEDPAESKKTRPNENGDDDDIVIMIESDDEDAVPLNNSNAEVSKWYSDYLQSLQRKYSDPFDAVIKSVMRSDEKSISENKKRALKAVLGFLLQFSSQDDNAQLFENLYHHSAYQRLLAVKHLTENFTQMNLTPESREIFSENIKDRLNDHNPEVVLQILQTTDSDFIEMIGREKILEKIFVIFDRYFLYQPRWLVCVDAAISLITSNKILNDDNCDEIFIRIFPFLFSKPEMEMLIETIINSDMGRRYFWLSDIDAKLDSSENLDVLLKWKNQLPKMEKIMKHVDFSKWRDHNFYFNCLLMALALPKYASPDIVNQFFDMLINYKLNTYSVSRLEYVPSITNIYAFCLDAILENADFLLFPEKMDLSNQTPIVVLVLKIFSTLVSKMFEADDQESLIYSNTLSNLLTTLFRDTSSRFRFLTNFFASHMVWSDTFVISPELQLMAIKLVCSIVKSCEKIDVIEIESIANILIGLKCKYSYIRRTTIKFLDIMMSLNPDSLLIGEILRFRQEILMDDEQIPLVLFNIFESKNPNHSTEIKGLLNEFLNLISDPKTPTYLVVGLLDLMKHINSLKVLEKTVTIGLDCYDSIPSDKSNNLMSHYKSNIISLIIMRYNEKIAKNIDESSNVFKFLLTTLEKHNSLIIVDNKITSPAAILLDNLTNEIVKQLNRDCRRKLLNSILEMVAVSDSNDIASSANKFMKNLDMTAEDLDEFLEAMIKANPESQETNRRSIKTETNFLHPGILVSSAWRKGVKLLEFLQNKKSIENIDRLIMKFFRILKKCLDFEAQSPVEYVKQMALSCILQSCVEISPDGSSKRNLLPDNVFQIDLVVQCIRSTQNPQTHHHALILLCHLASMVPDQVLHNIMDIFTFMGSSVVRLDDAYSAQIITKIIDKVIPILVQGNKNLSKSEKDNLTVPLLKIFSDIILDVPEHRRIPLYTKLIKTLGPSDYLWMFYGVLFENQVVKSDASRGKAGDTRRSEIALSLAKEFDADVLIETGYKFLEYLRQLPTNCPDAITNTSMDVDITDEVIFIIEARTPKQLRHFRYTILQFIGDLTSSTPLVNKIAMLPQETNSKMKTYYQNFIIKILMYIPEVSKTIEKTAKSPQNTYWKVVLNHCFDILDNVISLLAPDVFMIVVDGLIKHKIVAVRKRVVELLTSKIQHETDFADKYRHEDLMKILMQLKVIVSQVDVRDNHDLQILQQTCFIAIKLLSRIIATEYPEEFIEIIDALIDIIQQRDQLKLPSSVLATATICMSEICVNLKTHALSRLPKIMKNLLALSKSLIGLTASSDVLICFVTSIQKIVESIPRFISPYLCKIITRLSELKTSLSSLDEKLMNRFESIFTKLSTSIPGRVLIPAIDESFQSLIKMKKYSAIPCVMTIVLNSFDHIAPDDLSMLQSDLSNFFINALQFRSDYDGSNVDVNAIESSIISAFVHLILKLSESTFKPLYHRIYDWAIRDSSAEHPERAITFYALSYQIADALKSIFTYFAALFIDNAAELLDKCNSSKSDDLYLPDEEDNRILVTNIIKTLHSTFLYNSQNFINPTRFAIISQPLVDQIDNDVIATKDVKNLLSLCIAQLVASTNDDSLWKQLNYQVMLKTRNKSMQARLLAPRICVEIAKKLGVDFMPFLPETIPFMAELLEDEVAKVVKNCQKCIQELESVVGESLQKYF